MSPRQEGRRQTTTSQEIRSLLQKTNWDGYSSRVTSEVAKKAQAYKEARARSLEGSSRQVFV